MTTQMYTLLLLAVIFANLPFLTSRAWGIWAVAKKSIWQHLIEMALGFIITSIIAYFLEQRSGSVHSQGWAFFSVVICLYCVAGFPAFVWRYFWHSRHKA